MRRISYSVQLMRQFVGFARESKAYWIVPLMMILGLAAFLIVTSQAVAPYIYTLF